MPKSKKKCSVSIQTTLQRVSIKYLLYLCHIFNLSVKSATFPTIWKTAKVIPVFKNGGKCINERIRRSLDISMLSMLGNSLVVTVPLMELHKVRISILFSL